MEYIPSKTIQEFFSQLNSSGIEYVLIKNISNELPDKLKDGKDIDILVKENQRADFEKFMKSHNYKKRIHPYGRERGWNFVYKLPEHQFWQFNTKEYVLYVDVCFKLCCRSLTPNTWIPLDNCINEDVWKNKVFDKENNWWVTDEENQLVYLITRAIFDKKEFKDVYVSEIEKREPLLKTGTVKQKLSKVLFKYTDFLISQIENNNYENIVTNYLTFKSY